MDDLRGKVCLVTGASTGIGAAVRGRSGRTAPRWPSTYHRSADQAERVAEDIRAIGSRAVQLMP